MALISTIIYNHVHNSVAKGQKHRKSSPPPFMNVDTIIVMFPSPYSYHFFVTTLIGEGEGEHFRLFFLIFATYYVHDCF